MQRFFSNVPVIHSSIHVGNKKCIILGRDGNGIGFFLFNIKHLGLIDPLVFHFVVERIDISPKEYFIFSSGNRSKCVSHLNRLNLVINQFRCQFFVNIYPTLFKNISRITK